MRRDQLDATVKQLFIASKGRSGSPNITEGLQDLGAYHSKNTVANSMKRQALLKNNKLVCSMSRKGNCWDNAVAESFFHTLKVELIHGERFATCEQLRRAGK